MWFSADNLVLTVTQAGCVALPAAGVPAWVERFRTGAWALVLPLSIAGVVGAISVLPSTAWRLMLLRDTPAVSAICGRTSSYWRVETPRNRAPIMRSAVALFS